MEEPQPQPQPQPAAAQPHAAAAAATAAAPAPAAVERPHFQQGFPIPKSIMGVPPPHPAPPHLLSLKSVACRRVHHR